MKPTFARACTTRGRVKASARKITSGWTAWISAITQDQNAIGLVWGLSTRKIRTPCSIQKRRMPFASSQSASRSRPKKFRG